MNPFISEHVFDICERETWNVKWVILTRIFSGAAAEDACMELGGSLFMPDSEQELDFVADLFKYAFYCTA